MCVIFICGKQRATPEAIADAFAANGSGAGAAWREETTVAEGAKDDKGNDILPEIRVHWEKGLMKVEEIQALAARIPLPHVLHFRIPTVGGAVPELTHPFPVEKGAPLWLKGTTGGAVLFHNGHWHMWKSWTLELAKLGGGRLKVPRGHWSDSRAMAFAAATCGDGVLEFIDEKVCLFTPDQIATFGSGWTFIQDMWVSNQSWIGRTSRKSDNSYFLNRHGNSGARDDKEDPQPTAKSTSTDSKGTGSLTGDSGGSSAIRTFRAREAAARLGKNVEQPVQEGETTVSEAGRGGVAGVTSGSGGGAGEDASSHPSLGIADLQWVRTLNPSPFRRELPAVSEEDLARFDSEAGAFRSEDRRARVGEDDGDRVQRRLEADLGIQRLGPM